MTSLKSHQFYKENLMTRNNSRSYIKQSDVPKCTLETALQVAATIKEKCGGQPTSPLIVAQALNVTPTSRTFQDMCGASMAYGLTGGGSKANKIKLTSLGERIVSTSEGERSHLLQEAVLKPSIVKKYLERFDGNRVPPEDVAINIIKEDLSTSERNAKSLFKVIISNAKLAGFLRIINGQQFVHIPDDSTSTDSNEHEEDDATDGALDASEKVKPDEVTSLPEPESSANKNVFITHGSNRKILEQIRELLELANFTPIVAEEQKTPAIPIPYKIREGMRDCKAGIIHVETEKQLYDENGKEVVFLNQNVLIEIGAAMALYKDNFILLVEEGIDLPSNLQGLALIKYRGDELDYRTTIHVLKTLKTL